MNRAELLENYTAEQLAEMVEKYQKAFEALKFTDSFLEKTGLFSNPMVTVYEANIKVKEKQIQELEEKLKETDKVSVIIGGITKTYSIEEAGDIIRAYEDIKHCEEHNGEHLHSEEYLKIISLNREIDKMKCQLKYKQNEMDRMKEQFDRSQTTIDQIDEILEELFGVTHDDAKPVEFKDILRTRVSEKISNFLPAEPIKVADMLISAEGKYEHLNSIAKAICGTDKGTYRIFDVADLRQIAEHLLVYCNANERTGQNE